nr:hypothetical protein [Tanacetum cinerariifolium]
MTWRQFILALGLHTEQVMAEAGFGAYWDGSDIVIPDNKDLRDYWIEILDYWIEILSNRELLGPVPSYVLIQDPVRRLCHEMIAYNISGRGQAPEKVTGVDLFYLYSMDREIANVSHLLVQYLFRHAKGRKSGARLSGWHFIGRLAMHFGLVTPTLAPRQGPSPPPPTPQPRTMSQRIVRIEKEMRDLRHDVVVLRRVVESFTTSSSQMPYQRRIRPKTGDVSTSTAPHADDQPDP